MKYKKDNSAVFEIFYYANPVIWANSYLEMVRNTNSQNFFGFGSFCSLHSTGYPWWGVMTDSVTCCKQTGSAVAVMIKIKIIANYNEKNKIKINFLWEINLQCPVTFLSQPSSIRRIHLTLFCLSSVSATKDNKTFHRLDFPLVLTIAAMDYWVVSSCFHLTNTVRTNRGQN